MQSDNVHVVTGAYGFSGKYIAKRLLEAGHQVRTLTNSIGRENPFGDKLTAYAFNFDDKDKMIKSLQGGTVLYNNYWVRFNYADHTSFTYANAVDNSLKLFQAAKEAGIKKIVHVSITNPSEDSPFEYFRGKARLEQALKDSGLSYAILRPAVLFGKEDILINNIAWFLRRLPVFGVFGAGEYRLQPIYVDDLARLAVEQGQLIGNLIIDAIGPETFTYRGLVEAIGRAIGKQRTIVSIPPSLGYAISALAGKILGDVLITHDEIQGLMAGLLYTGSLPTGETRLTDWLRERSDSVGIHYSSELARRNNRSAAYENLWT
jgi:NADH dehydrogenase